MSFDVSEVLRVKGLVSLWRSFPTAKAVAVITISSLFAVTVESAALARDNVNVTIYGVGAFPCTSWSSTRQMLSVTGTPSALAWEQMGWVLGYLTSFGQFALPSGANPPGGLAVAAELDAYCDQHPDELLAVAVSKVAMVVSGRTLQAAEP